MPNVAQLNGTLTAGPPSVTDTTFPSQVTNIGFSLSPPSKPANVQASEVRQVNSPSAYVTLSGPGANDSVTQGNTLYVRTQNPMLIRLTFFGSSGNTVSILPLSGIFVMEIDPGQYLVTLEAKGSGTVEWFVSGNL